MEAKIAADKLIEKGIALLQDNNPLGALSCFEKACGLNKSPVAHSYLGLCIATERGKISEAVALCLDAIANEPDRAVHYLNLGKVYLKAGRKDEALKVLRTGLAHEDNAAIHALLEVIGNRKRPLFPGLPRGHFLNKYPGLLLSRLRLR